MKWVVATIGAVIVTLGAFVALMLLPLLIFPMIYQGIAGVIALYVVVTPLAITAGVLSFRATLRQYAKP